MTTEGDNPPIGLLLCKTPGDPLVHYALDNLPIPCSISMPRWNSNARPIQALLDTQRDLKARAREDHVKINGLVIRKGRSLQRPSTQGVRSLTVILQD